MTELIIIIIIIIKEFRTENFERGGTDECLALALTAVPSLY